MTPDQIRWLTWGAIQHRPHGAPKWDEPGTHKAIADHCGSWGFAIATQHVLAHARDEKARTPFAIKGNPPHNEPAGGPRFPAPKGEAECPRHKGEWATSCRACAADRLAGEPDERPGAITEDFSAPVAHLRALREQATAELCSHGVALTNCLDHAKSRTEEPTDTYLAAKSGLGTNEETTAHE